MEIIQLQPLPEGLEEFMSMPNGVVKNIKYNRDIFSKNFEEVNLCKKEGKTYFSVNGFTVKRSKNNSYYKQRKTRDGFTIDEKGKLKIWFGKTVFQIPHIGKVFAHYNFNWLDYRLYPFITKTIMEKIFAGKITNGTDVIKAYFKVMHINASPALFMKLLFTENISFSKQDFLRQASVSKDVNHMIESMINMRSITYNDDFHQRSQILYDMINEAQILNKKIDFTWSLNRMKEEHKAWTQEIMQAEIESLEETILPSFEKFDKYTPQGFTLLKTQREVFMEGKQMGHCVYTGYWNNIKAGSYLAYHIDIDGEQATLGLNVYDDAIYYNQCYTKYNQSVSPKLSAIVKEFTDRLSVQALNDGLIKIKSLVVEPLLPF